MSWIEFNVEDKAEFQRYAYLTALFASGFTGGVAGFNFVSGEEFLIYVTLSASMLAVAAGNYYIYREKFGSGSQDS